MSIGFGAFDNISIEPHEINDINLSDE